jgi:hypothetical protein
VIDPHQNPAAGSEKVRLPGPLSVLNGLATETLSTVQRTIVYGVMPQVVRDRLGAPFGWRDQTNFAAICAALRALTPAISRGLMQQLFPAGTPRLKPGSRDQITTGGSTYVPMAQRNHSAPVSDPRP